MRVTEEEGFSPDACGGDGIEQVPRWSWLEVPVRFVALERVVGVSLHDISW